MLPWQQHTRCYSVSYMIYISGAKLNYFNISGGILAGTDPGEVKWVNVHPPFSESPFFLFLIPQILIGSITLLQKFTHYFKLLDPRLT